MRTLRISKRNDQVLDHTEQAAPTSFWDRWNSLETAAHWCRTEVDRDGNPYTVKWHSHAFLNGAGAWIRLTLAMEADGVHPPRHAGKTPRAAAQPAV